MNRPKDNKDITPSMAFAVFVVFLIGFSIPICYYGFHIDHNDITPSIAAVTTGVVLAAVSLIGFSIALCYFGFHPDTKYTNRSMIITVFVVCMAVLLIAFSLALCYFGFHINNPSMDITKAVVYAAVFIFAFYFPVCYYILCCDAIFRGLKASVIETFPTFSYAEVKEHKIGEGTLECVVCLNEFEEDETIRLILKCDHVFHPECIDAWLESHVTCPVCRADLTPQPDDGSYHLPETDQQAQENNTEASGNDNVTIQIPDDQTRERSKEERPRVNWNWSFNILNRPPRTESVKRGRSLEFGRFRSHSTGHSLGQAGLVQPGENGDRFTLRLPEGIRQEMMNRALLNRTKSTAMGLPSDGGSRRGNGSGCNRWTQQRRKVFQ